MALADSRNILKPLGFVVTVLILVHHRGMHQESIISTGGAVAGEVVVSELKSPTDNTLPTKRSEGNLVQRSLGSPLVWLDMDWPNWAIRYSIARTSTIPIV